MAEDFRRRWDTAFAPAAHIDWLLVLAALLLSAFGLLMVSEATAARGDAEAFVSRQLLAFGVGVVAAILVALPDYRAYRAWAAVAYGGTLLLLTLVLIPGIGREINGAQAWIVLGPVQFQPSELAKITLVLMLAAHFHEYREEALGLRALVEALAFAAFPMLLILLQPDFGTFIVFVVIVAGVLLMARVKVRYLLALVALGITVIVAALQLGFVAEYQLDRLTAFANPQDADPADVYNVEQAQIAVGSGQLFGQGLGRESGSQTEQGFVPENQTDFIFTVVGEKTGFVGSLLLLGLFGLLIGRAWRIGLLSRDTLGTLIAGGVIATFTFQMFINIGMTMGIMPVTGLPLPFISYGGTSLIASLVMVGLLQSVHMRRFTR